MLLNEQEDQVNLDFLLSRVLLSSSFLVPFSALLSLSQPENLLCFLPKFCSAYRNVGFTGKCSSVCLNYRNMSIANYFTSSTNNPFSDFFSFKKARNVVINK